MAKCRAFRLVVRHTTEAQAGRAGPISPDAADRIQAELNAAKKMPPTSLTPFQCGVPL